MAQLVKVNIEGLKRFGAAVAAGMRGGGKAAGPIGAAFRQWGARFRAFIRERFAAFSRGGGDWADLKESTKRRRQGPRKGAKGARSFAILRDTGTLLNAVDPTFSGKPGQLQQDIPFGIRVGYGGPGRHPKGKATIADIAAFHQEGAGHLPARKIIVAPSPASDVVNQMAEDMNRALKAIAANRL
jgi:hypothetical protein